METMNYGAVRFLCDHSKTLRDLARPHSPYLFGALLTVSAALDCEAVALRLNLYQIPQHLLDAIGHCNEARFLINRAREVQS